MGEKIIALKHCQQNLWIWKVKDKQQLLEQFKESRNLMGVGAEGKGTIIIISKQMYTTEPQKRLSEESNSVSPEDKRMNKWKSKRRGFQV